MLFNIKKYYIINKIRAEYIKMLYIYIIYVYVCYYVNGFKLYNILITIICTCFYENKSVSSIVTVKKVPIFKGYNIYS